MFFSNSQIPQFILVVRNWWCPWHFQRCSCCIGCSVWVQSLMSLDLEICNHSIWNQNDWNDPDDDFKTSYFFEGEQVSTLHFTECNVIRRIALNVKHSMCLAYMQTYYLRLFLFACCIAFLQPQDTQVPRRLITVILGLQWRKTLKTVPCADVAIDVPCFSMSVRIVWTPCKICSVGFNS